MNIFIMNGFDFDYNYFDYFIVYLTYQLIIWQHLYSVIIILKNS